MVPLLAQVLAQGFLVDLNSLARVAEQALLPEVIHLKGDDLTSGTHVLGEHLVGERRNLDEPSSVRVPMPSAKRSRERTTRSGVLSSAKLCSRAW